MGEAMELSAEKLAFIRKGAGESPQPTRNAVKAVKPATQPDDSERDGGEIEAAVVVAGENQPTRRPRTRRVSRESRQAPDSPSLDEFLVSKSFRLRYSTVEALNEAWLDRKRRHRNAKLQEIAQEAIDEWLRRHDYID